MDADKEIIVIKTGIDAFYDTIISKGTLTEDEAAKILSVSRETLERWAEILAKNNMIVAKYPLFGKAMFYPAKYQEAKKSINSDKKCTNKKC